MYPTAYNDEKEITRYFDFKFIDSEEFFSVVDWDKKIENFSSAGVVYAIIPYSNEEIERIREVIKRVTVIMVELYLCCHYSLWILRK